MVLYEDKGVQGELYFAMMRVDRCLLRFVEYSWLNFPSSDQVSTVD